MFKQEYFEVAKEYKIPLTGYYNVLVYECQDCNHSMIDELHDHIIGFADSQWGIMAIIECPNCFEKYFSHADKLTYRYFLNSIKQGKQKHFKE